MSEQTLAIARKAAQEIYGTPAKWSRALVDEATEIISNAIQAATLKEWARIEQLEAVVEKLPKTVDGVPVTPDMELWQWFNVDSKRVLAHGHAGPVDDAYTDDSPDRRAYCMEVSKCFSTRSAAEAAEATKEGAADGK